MNKIYQPYPTVAIIGRTNVGKSTIFNRLTEKKGAITSPIPGTTRDKRLGQCLWAGKTIVMMDTAGLDVKSKAEIDVESIKQAKLAIKEADVVLFVVDGQDGLLPQDKEFALLVKKSGKPAILTINKIESQKQEQRVSEFYKLGFKNVQTVSARTGSGTGDLLEMVFGLLANKFEETKNAYELTNEIKIAIIGKPNVGKSSLLNKIIGKEISIVSPIPHTTRDSQDVTVELDHEGKNYFFTFIDTAGIIKKRKIKNKMQRQSIKESLESIEKSDLVLLLVDAMEPITIQDKNITREILERNKSLIFVINKWDLVRDKTTNSDKDFTLFIRKNFPYLTWAPIVFLSAKTGEKVQKLTGMIINIYNNQHQQLSESQLNHFMQYVLKKQSPQKTEGIKPPYIHKIKHIKTTPVTFEVIADQSDNIHFSYIRYLQNQLRQRFGYDGCGIKIVLTEVRKKKKHQT